MSHFEEEARRNREKYPLIFEALSEVREIFGDGVKLIAGVSIDGATVGKEPRPGWFDDKRKRLEQQTPVPVDRSSGESERW